MAKWSELPAKAQLGIAVAVVALVTAAMYFLAFKSMIEENEKAKNKLRTVQADNDNLRPYENKLAELDRQIESLKQQLDIQKRIVPEEKEADNFIRLMQSTASNAGIEIRRYTSARTSPKEFYVEVPFELELDGPYYSVLTFFDKLSKVERIVNISALQMASVKSPGPAKTKNRYNYAPNETVVATCLATTYFSKEPDATPPPPPPGAPKPAAKR